MFLHVNIPYNTTHVTANLCHSSKYHGIEFVDQKRPTMKLAMLIFCVLQMLIDYSFELKIKNLICLSYLYE